MSFSRAKPRILFFLPEAGAGGAEKIFSQLVTRFPTDEVDVLVATDPAIGQRIRQEGDRQPNYLPWLAEGSFETPGKIPREVRRLRRILSREAVTHLFAMKHYAAALAAMATRLMPRRPRLIQSLRGPAEPHIAAMVPGWATRLYLRAMVRLSAAWADRISVPARGIAGDLVANFGVPREKIAVIPNGIDLGTVERLCNSPEDTLWIEPGRRYFLSVGRLAPEKRLEWVLDGFALITRQLPDVQLLILGEGPERDGLEQRACDAGIRDRVSFLGHQANIYPYLRRAEALLHSCQYEGLPNAIIEAMACGTPVVATDCPFGPRELLGNNERGLLVPPRDPAALARAIQRLISDRALRSQLIVAARGYVEKQTLSTMIAQYRDLILQA